MQKDAGARGIIATRGCSDCGQHACARKLWLQAPPGAQDRPGVCPYALVRSRLQLFRTADAWRCHQDEVASAKEEQAQKDSKRRRTSDRESVQMQQEMEVDASHKESKRRSTGAHNSSRADAAGEEKREKKKESREERKERKEREARKAAKEALRKEKDKAIAEAKAAKDGGSSKQGKEISLPNRASPRYKGESSMTGAGGSSKHRPPALTVGGSSSGGEGGSRGVKAGKEPAESYKSDKGKGKAAMTDDEDEPVAGYEALSKGQKVALHKEIPVEEPDAKRLQSLLELAVEAEVDAVRKHLGSRNSTIAHMFEDATSQFIIEMEGITISKLKRAAGQGKTVQKLEPNPVNEAKQREEAQLIQALATFQKEEKEWERVLAAPAPKSAPVRPYPPLPAPGTLPSSSHALMQELSIAHRNLLSSQVVRHSVAPCHPAPLPLMAQSSTHMCTSTPTNTLTHQPSESEMPELLAWAHGYVHSGLDKARKALASLEQRSEDAEQLRNKIIAGMAYSRASALLFLCC